MPRVVLGTAESRALVSIFRPSKDADERGTQRYCPAVEQNELVPQDKFDTAAARRAMAVGWPGIEPFVAELLEWIQDYNWPVARALMPLLASIGEPLAPYLKPVLDGDDDIWKLNVIQGLLIDASAELVRHFAPTLKRIANSPTLGEHEEAVDLAAATALERDSA